jgi:hypothetical protein
MLAVPGDTTPQLPDGVQTDGAHFLLRGLDAVQAFAVALNETTRLGGAATTARIADGGPSMEAAVDRPPYPSLRPDLADTPEAARCHGHTGTGQRNLACPGRVCRIRISSTSATDVLPRHSKVRHGSY